MRDSILFRAAPSSSNTSLGEFEYASRFECGASSIDDGPQCTAFVGPGEYCSCKQMRNSKWCRKHDREKKVLYSILKTCEKTLVKNETFTTHTKSIAYKIYDLRKRISNFYDKVDEGHSKAAKWWVNKVQEWERQQIVGGETFEKEFDRLLIMHENADNEMIRSLVVSKLNDFEYATQAAEQKFIDERQFVPPVDKIHTISEQLIMHNTAILSPLFDDGVQSGWGMIFSRVSDEEDKLSFLILKTTECEFSQYDNTFDLAYPIILAEEEKRLNASQLVDGNYYEVIHDASIIGDVVVDCEIRDAPIIFNNILDYFNPDRIIAKVYSYKVAEMTPGLPTNNDFNVLGHTPPFTFTRCVPNENLNPNQIYPLTFTSKRNPITTMLREASTGKKSKKKRGKKPQ